MVRSFAREERGAQTGPGGPRAVPLDTWVARKGLRARAVVPAVTADILEGQVRGRTVIDVNA